MKRALQKNRPSGHQLPGSQTETGTVNKKEFGTLKSPTSMRPMYSLARVHTFHNFSNTGFCTGIDHGMTIRGLHHPPTAVMDGITQEHRAFSAPRPAAQLQRQSHVDSEPSKIKMWDPVKDCGHTNLIQADLPGLVPASHNSGSKGSPAQVPGPEFRMTTSERQVPSADVSRALGAAHHAKTLDEQSHYTEALRAYEGACTLLQDVIIRSHSVGEGINEAVSQ